jgi:drug/metabolite transporter (DMT)-like permease
MVESTAGNRDLTFGAAVATVVLCLAFGANAPAIRLAIEGFGPLTMGGLRFSVSAVVIAAWACAAREPLRLPWPLLRRLLLLSLAFLVQISLFYLGLARTYASRGTLIGNLQPFLVLFLAHFFLEGERITLRRLLGMTLGFGGVAALFADEGSIVAELRTGDLLVLAAVVIWSGTTVFIKRVIDDYNPFQLSFYPMLVCAPAMLLAGAICDDPMIRVLSARALGGLAYQALLTASIGFVAWNTLFKRHGAVAMNSYLFLQPIAGVGLGGLLLGEPVATIGVLLGLPLVVAGIVIVNWRSRTERNAQ